MPLHSKLFLGILGLIFLISCSSSHSSNDTDILPDADLDSDEIVTQDDDLDSQGSEIVDDSDETPDENSDIDTDSDTEAPVPDDEEPNEPAEEIFEETEPINGYARCYDKIPAGPYKGFFADPNLEYWVKRSLEYDEDEELTEEDLKRVTRVSIYSKDIRGIEKLINLASVTILGNNLYDYTPLSKLEKLKTVKIDSTSMNCIDGSFSLLTNLETLEIRETKLKDVSPIERLENLTSLDLIQNQIEFLPENIGNLQKIENLVFVYNNIKNIEPLKPLINLKELFFHYNRVEDISPVKDLVNLTRLGAQGNQIKDISAVTDLVNLTYLGFDENQINEIPAEITNLKKLQTFELTYNNISNLPELKGLDSLVEMYIGSNDLNDEDLMRLDDLETVQILHVPLCKKITKVPIMKNLKSLKELYLNYNSITDLSGFADNESFPALRRLDVGSNKIENVEAFRNRIGLSSLYVDKNCIKDFSPLEELKERGTHVGGMNEQLESCGDTTTIFKDGE